MCVVGVLGLTTTLLTTGPARAQTDPAPVVTEDLIVPMSDGTELLVRLGGRGPLVDGHLPPRPVIAEFSPYGQACCPELAGPAFNYLQVHIRGTGASGGQFDALGPRSQADVVEVLDWACAQPWSNGTTGLWGFSASAIMVYNSLHAELPCVEAAVLGAGTHELYRDLLYPGGIPNGLPALGVFGLIGAPTVPLLPDRLGRDPLSLVDVALGLGTLAVDYLAHPTLDDWWLERGMRGNVNDIPVLMITGFFDVESRGPFEAFAELAPHGAHLYVVGAHDGVPASSGGADVPRERWFEHNLLGVDNGIDDEPAVQLWLADGDRADMLAGDFVTLTGDRWPLGGTRWSTLHLDPTRSGSAASLNDGTLALAPPATAAHDLHVPIQSLPTATDPYTTSLLGVFNGSPELTLMNGPEILGLSYTTEPLTHDVTLVGPASAELVVTNSVPESDLYAVISDVWPDGSAHPMAAGRLRSSFPDIVEDRSRVVDGAVVQPYGDFSAKRTVTPWTEHRYHVEFWPIGNRFAEGHRIRLHVVGASGYHMPTLTGPMLVRLGGDDGGSLLRLPVAPGGDLVGALGGARGPSAPDRPPTPAPELTESAAAGGGEAELGAVANARGPRLPVTGGRGRLLVPLVVVVAALALSAARSRAAARSEGR